jgi:hypothetical protein
VGETLVQRVAAILRPVVTDSSSCHPPAYLDYSYWLTALSLYVGYLIIISVLLFIKRMFLTQAAHAH